MKIEPFGWIARGMGSRIRLPRGLGQKLSVGFLAAMLAATAALPVAAKGPHPERTGRRHHPEQHVSAEKTGADVAVEGKKGRRARTVKKTFANGGLITIPAAGPVELPNPADPYPSTIAATGFKRKPKIVDVNLTLRNFSHEFTQDVDLLLVAPNGRNAMVMSDVGLGAAADLTLTLDDEAAEELPLDEDLTSGVFRPLNFLGGGADTFLDPAPDDPSDNSALSIFDGINPNGRWQLFIVDDGSGDMGKLGDGWSLEITAKSKKRKR